MGGQCIRDGQFVVVVLRCYLPRLESGFVRLLGGNDATLVLLYSGTSVEALVVEVNSIPPPPPVAAPAPLRVDSDWQCQCVTKGCAEGRDPHIKAVSGEQAVVSSGEVTLVM
ncbi:hypothetical protein cypCar_00045672 [Cyprinus carpio]|nr:hypothetical protein cypCar_00045672 [Cyprinus carpio]